jgi:hypothetical protein
MFLFTRASAKASSYAFYVCLVALEAQHSTAKHSKAHAQFLCLFLETQNEKRKHGLFIRFLFRTNIRVIVLGFFWTGSARYIQSCSFSFERCAQSGRVMEDSLWSEEDAFILGSLLAMAATT